MCTILNFAPASKGTIDPKACEQPPKKGEVVIFPGVRYERHEPAASSVGLREADLAKRDFLNL